MDMLDSKRDRRDTINQERAADKRRREIEDGLNRLLSKLDVTLRDALDDGLTWWEAIDAIGAWWDQEAASRKVPPRK